MESIWNDQAQFWVVFGVVLLIVEIMILGLSTGGLLFAGIGALLTSAAMYLGWLPATFAYGAFSTGIIATVMAVLLWKPFKQLQNQSEPENAPASDLVGLTFSLSSDVSTDKPGEHKYSGIQWTVVVDPSHADSLIKGQQVTVTDVSVGKLTVKPV